MTTSEALAGRIAQLAGSELPRAALDRAAVAVLDTIGVTLAGSVTRTARLQRAVILRSAGPGPASVLGTGRQLNVLDATLLNATAGHALDYDDSNPRLQGHPSLAVLPASLAIAQETGASGADVLRAYVVGFEVASRLGDAVGLFQYTHGWHPSATIGIFATIASASVLLGLDEAHTATALSLGVSFAAGVKSNFGSDGKPLGLGQAMRNGVLACLLAREGLTAMPEAFDHVQGYFNVFNAAPANYDAESLAGEWSGPLALLDNGLQQKRYPCCYSCLAPVDGVQQLAEANGIRAEDVEGVEVRVHPIRHPHVNRPDPRSGLEAKFSLHYCVARHLERSVLTIGDFDGDTIFDPATRELMSRVTFATHELDGIATAVVEITTRDGHRHRTIIPSAWGATDGRPLTPALLEAKFLDGAGQALGPDGARTLHNALLHFDEWRDLSALARLTTPTPEIVGSAHK